MAKVSKPLLLAIILVLSVALAGAVRLLNSSQEDGGWLALQANDRPRVISIVKRLPMPAKAKEAACPVHYGVRCFLLPYSNSSDSWEEIIRGFRTHGLPNDGIDFEMPGCDPGWSKFAACHQVLLANGSALPVVLQRSDARVYDLATERQKATLITISVGDPESEPLG